MKKWSVSKQAPTASQMKVVRITLGRIHFLSVVAPAPSVS